MLIISSGIEVPLSHDLYDEVVSKLTRTLFTYNGEKIKLEVFIRKPDKIIIPRFYEFDSEVIVDGTEKPLYIDITSSISLRDRQKKYSDVLKDINYGIIKAEPGFGKTVLSIHEICRCKLKTLIILNKTPLINGWKKEFISKTNIDESDIGVLKTKDLTQFDKPIILATIQCLMYGIKNEDFLYKLQNSGIGLVFFDECHNTIGPEQFSKVSLSIKAKRIFGVSATPIRSDMADIVNLHLGDTIYFEEDENDCRPKPIIYMIYVSFGIWKLYKNPKYYFMFNGRFQYTRYEKAMIKSKSYLNIVSNIIRRSYFKGNKKILVLGKITQPILELIKTTKLDKSSVGIAIPTSTKEERLLYSDTCDLDTAFFNRDVVFSTFKYARDGNNRVDFDCLVQFCICSNIEQAVGRIQRDNPGKEPFVFDFIDTDIPPLNSLEIGYMIKQSEKRLNEYLQRGWEVKKVYLDENGNYKK